MNLEHMNLEHITDGPFETALHSLLGSLLGVRFDFGHGFSFSRSLFQRRGFVSCRSPRNSALGVSPIRALPNEGGAGRRRLAGLHGLMCGLRRSTSEYVLTAVAGS
jgi:hypothetical protein